MQYVKLNPAELKRQITRLQNKLLRLASLKEELGKERLNNKTFFSGRYLGFSGLTSEPVLSDNIDLEDDKNTKLVEVDFS